MFMKKKKRGGGWKRGKGEDEEKQERGEEVTELGPLFVSQIASGWLAV